jgi:hypothetical protein
MLTAGSDEAAWWFADRKRKFVNGWGAERKGNAFADVAIAGTGQVYCVVNSFLVGISFFWATLRGPHGCAAPSGSGMLWYRIEQYAIGDSRTARLCGRNVPKVLLIQVIGSYSFLSSLHCRAFSYARYPGRSNEMP